LENKEIFSEVKREEMKKNFFIQEERAGDEEGSFLKNLFIIDNLLCNS